MIVESSASRSSWRRGSRQRHRGRANRLYRRGSTMLRRGPGSTMLRRGGSSGADAVDGFVNITKNRR